MFVQWAALAAVVSAASAGDHADLFSLQDLKGLVTAATAGDVTSYISSVMGVDNGTLTCQGGSCWWRPDVECLSPEELLRVSLGAEMQDHAEDQSVFNSSALKSLCPALLHQLTNAKCPRFSRFNGTEKGKPSPSEVWGYGFLLVTAISSCSIIGAFLLPLVGMRFYDSLMTTLIGLAMGSLSSSALFHLIPQAFRLPELYGNHDYLLVALTAICGIYGFYVIERFLKTVIEHKRRRRMLAKLRHSPDLPNHSGSLGRGSSRDSGGMDKLATNESLVMTADDCCVAEPLASSSMIEDGEEPGQFCGMHPNVAEIYKAQEQVIKASFGHQTRPHRDKHALDHRSMFMNNEPSSPATVGSDSLVAASAAGVPPSQTTTIATVAWMVIFGDGLHNFIDGVSIGAAFSESTLIGVSVSIAIICEEFPHELGDLAVLLNSGMTMKQALLYNFMSAAMCYLGLVLGILLGNLHEAAHYVFGLAAGIFLYIALADMIPEMNEAAEKASKKSVMDVLFVLTLQTIGFVVGVASLFFLAYYQDQIHFK